MSVGSTLLTSRSRRAHVPRRTHGLDHLPVPPLCSDQDTL
ncbi:hypothetical protein IG631_16075 [Alternaria alternata]|nr:hypothetical protein IG631_16075 [Alternaria alternata]